MKKLLALLNLFLILSIFFVSTAFAFEVDIDIKTNGNETNQTNDTGGGEPPVEPPGLDIANKVIDFLKDILTRVLTTLLQEGVSK